MITTDAKSVNEIKRRIQMAKSSFINLRTILTNTNISLQTRLPCVKCYVGSIFLYGSETWTLTTQTEKNIDTFEMWTYRRILKIPWTAKKTNIEVLEKVGLNSKQLIQIIKRRKLNCLISAISEDMTVWRKEF